MEHRVCCVQGLGSQNWTFRSHQRIQSMSDVEWWAFKWLIHRNVSQILLLPFCLWKKHLSTGRTNFGTLPWGPWEPFLPPLFAFLSSERVHVSFWRARFFYFYRSAFFFFVTPCFALSRHKLIFPRKIGLQSCKMQTCPLSLLHKMEGNERLAAPSNVCPLSPSTHILCVCARVIYLRRSRLENW